jgi:hypothetical protein
MKRLFLLLFLICLSVSTLSTSDLFARTPDLQIKETTTSGDFVTVVDVIDDAQAFGDPDDAITGNRGADGANAFGDTAISEIEQSLLDHFVIHFVLGLISR